MTKEYSVDFEEWIVTAENEDEVYKKVEDRISSGDIPKINLVEEN